MKYLTNLNTKKYHRYYCAIWQNRHQAPKIGLPSITAFSPTSPPPIDTLRPPSIAPLYCSTGLVRCSKLTILGFLVIIIDLVALQRGDNSSLLLDGTIISWQSTGDVTQVATTSTAGIIRICRCFFEGGRLLLQRGGGRDGMVLKLLRVVGNRRHGTGLVRHKRRIRLVHPI